jgi:hypothetical protein
MEKRGKDWKMAIQKYLKYSDVRCGIWEFRNSGI